MHLLVVVAVVICVAHAALNNLGQKPYMGWTSWDLMAIKNHPKYGRKWLTSANLRQQSDAMNKTLQKYGFQYLNIDSFWHDEDVDEFGRWLTNTTVFPEGIKALADHVHANGQKFGLYLNPGMPKMAYEKNSAIEGTSCRARDIAAMPLRPGNYFNNTWAIDFKGHKECADAYMRSYANLLAKWEIDYLKIDAVSPGSWSQIDTKPDIESWAIALNKTGRQIWFELSWHLDIKELDFWRKYSNGWRIFDDVDCYCDTLLTWESVRRMFHVNEPWAIAHQRGTWNDFDSVLVGNGKLSGMSDIQRKTYAAFWAISCTPFYTGNDLTDLDPYGFSLLTNPEVLAVNQMGDAAKVVPEHSKKNQQAWVAKHQDGTFTVGMFNIEGPKSTVGINFKKDLGIDGKAVLRDLWSRKDIGTQSLSYTRDLDTHDSFLFKVTPIK